MGQGRYAAQIGWGRGADNFFFAGGLAGGKARISLEVSSSRLFARDSGYVEPVQHPIVLLPGYIEASARNL